MSSSDTITVLIPRFNNRVVTMSWARTRRWKVSDFITSCSGNYLRTSRYASLISFPVFRLHLGTQEHGINGTPVDNDCIVGDVIRSGDRVVLLSSDDQNMNRRDLSYSVPPLFRRPEGITTEEEDEEEVPQSFIAEMLGDERDIGTQILESIEEHLPSTRTVSFNALNAMSLINAMFTGAVARRREAAALMSGEENPPVALLSGVRKVITRDTFIRVCPTVAVDSISEEEACTICISSLKSGSCGDEIRQMPNCSHKFHSECIVEWLTHNAITCPVCRAPAVTKIADYGYLGYGGREDEYTPAEGVSSVSAPPVTTGLHALTQGIFPRQG